MCVKESEQARARKIESVTERWREVQREPSHLTSASVSIRPPWDSTEGICLGLYGGPRGGVLFLMRQSPVYQKY